MKSLIFLKDVLLWIWIAFGVGLIAGRLVNEYNIIAEQSSHYFPADRKELK